MKKVLFLLTVFAVVFSAACSAAEAADPGYLFAPCETEPAEVSGSNGVVLYNGDTYLRVTATEDPENGDYGDPYFIIDQTLDAKYEWIRMRIKNMSVATQFEFHFASTATNDAITAESCTHFPITANDEDYKEYIFNIREYNLASQNVNEGTHLDQSAWSGTISRVRFDCMWVAEPSGQVPYMSKMDIDYIGFFDSEESAKAYQWPTKKVNELKSTEWDKNSPHYILTDPQEVDQWLPNGGGTSYSMGNLRMIVTSSDPMLTRLSYEPFNTADYPYFAYRFKSNSHISVGGIFFTTNTLTTLSDASYSQFDIPQIGEWCNVVMDMRTFKQGNWKGTFTGMRLDPVNSNQADIGAEILINRLGFFKSEDEALAFLAEGTSEDYSSGTTFSGDMCKVVVPDGGLYEGYSESEYLLSSSTPEGEGKSPVVMYTSADGQQSIVALSYTNSAGYTSYVAAKPGSYKLGYNHKDYTDTAGHWGADYIDFVSDRNLFGGTSPTEFSPDMTMTRGMFITVLGRMHGLDTSVYDGNTGYTDVPATEYYAPYIQWAKQYGIMAGTSDTTFAPEQPITRAEMAVVIKNYIDNGGFDVKVYVETEGFNDLAGLDEATVNAINTVKNIGIINGKGEGQFDPNGISTRAEVAAVMQRVVKAVLGMRSTGTTYDEQYFTRDRIRIGVWGFKAPLATPKGMKDLADLGVDTIVHGEATSANPELVLSCADYYGIEVHLGGYYPYNASPSDADTQKFLEADTAKSFSAPFIEHPSYAGVFITDEPGTDYFANLGKMCDAYEEAMPGKRAFVNLLPMYANAAQLKYGAHAASIEYYDPDPNLFRNYCQEWCDTNNGDYICTDIYPLFWSGQTKTYYNAYVESINQIATVARENGREFWCCIQTYGWNASKRTPNEAEYRWQCYCMLSFGATGIVLWQYMSGNNNFPSVVDSTGEPTPAYYDCQPVMWELRKLSDTFIQYKNLGAFTHNATKGYQQMSGEYKNFDTIKSIESGSALLIGCFEKKEGEGTAFTVVNMEDFQQNLSARCRINLDPSKNVTVYYRGEPSDIKPVNGVLTLDLDCGDGVFVTVD